mgnify:FL=1
MLLILDALHLRRHFETLRAMLRVSGAYAPYDFIAWSKAACAPARQLRQGYAATELLPVQQQPAV